MPSFWKSNRASKSHLFFPDQRQQQQQDQQQQHPGELPSPAQRRRPPMSRVQANIARPSAPHAWRSTPASIPARPYQDTDHPPRRPASVPPQRPSDALPAHLFGQRSPEHRQHPLEYVLLQTRELQHPLNCLSRPPLDCDLALHARRPVRQRRSQLFLLRRLVAFTWYCWSQSLCNGSQTRRNWGNRRHKLGR